MDARDVQVAVPFLLRLELLPGSPISGITALKKGTLRSSFPGYKTNSYLVLIIECNQQ